MIERSEALAVARTLDFRVFGRFDYDAYAGVVSALPLIAENEHYTFVLDGQILEVTENETGDWETFNLLEND